MALRFLGVNVRHCFSSDINSHVQETIRLNYPGSIIYDDLQTRDNKSAPPVDLYHAGFPCQSFSTAGKGKGMRDPRGALVLNVLEYIQVQSPTVVILENVRGLVTRHREVLDMVIKKLTKFGYNVFWQVLNARDHGLPHNRERLFIVGIRVECEVPGVEFKWPSPMPTPPIQDFLDPVSPTDDPDRLPPSSQTISRKHVKTLHRALLRKGINPARSRLIADIQGSRLHLMHNVSPCLTRTRAAGGGHWVVSRGRYMTVTEMERLMGLHVGPRPVSIQRPVGVPTRAWGAIIGNSIPIPLLARVLRLVLPAAGLVDGCLPDWGH
jgi:DNA (cytosine-5)-methyltransferase 1